MIENQYTNKSNTAIKYISMLNLLNKNDINFYSLISEMLSELWGEIFEYLDCDDILN